MYSRSLNYDECAIPVHKLSNWPFRSPNLFSCVIPASKLANHLFRSSDLFICLILVSKLGVEPHLGQSGRFKNFISNNNLIFFHINSNEDKFISNCSAQRNLQLCSWNFFELKLFRVLKYCCMFIDFEISNLKARFGDSKLSLRGPGWHNGTSLRT